MKKTEIMKKQAKDNIKYEVAMQIRDLLDAAKKSYGAQDWDDDDMEAAIAELVFDE